LAAGKIKMERAKWETSESRQGGITLYRENVYVGYGEEKRTKRREGYGWCFGGASGRSVIRRKGRVGFSGVIRGEGVAGQQREKKIWRAKCL